MIKHILKEIGDILFEYKRLLKILCERRILQTGEFTLKHNRLFPGTPKSFFKIEFDLATGEDIKRIVVWMKEDIIWQQAMGYVKDIQMVAGVPDGGNRIARELARILKVPFLELAKDEKGSFFIVGGSFPDKRVLLVDDVLNWGSSSGEAVKVLRNSGFKVNNIYFAVDRQQGGSKHLRKLKCTPKSAFTAMQITRQSVKMGILSKEKESLIKQDIRSKRQSAGS